MQITFVLRQRETETETETEIGKQHTQRRRRDVMKKSKGENLLSPSSSWRETPLPRRRKSNSAAVSDFGCLPSFFHLLFRNPRKSLTFGSKKREQRTVVCASLAEKTSHAPPESHARPQGEGEAARMSLVGALEKCDRDLEELRRTIDVIKTTFFLQQKLPLPPPATTAARDHFIKFSDTGGDVLRRKKMTTAQEADKDTTNDKTHDEVDVIKTDFNVGSIKNDVTMRAKRSPVVVGKVRRSMVESVNQVCDDVAWGERREVGRIGLALHDHICRDLINETVRDLSFSGDFSSPPPSVFCGRRRTASLPLDACRRRLVFS